MARQLRLEFAGGLYHLTARGNAQAAIYQDNDDRKLFLDLLGREIDQQGWLCYAYCLMDNHYHLLIETPEANLSKGMRRLNQVYTQAFNRRHGRVGHVLQGRYKSIVVDKDSYFLELSRYIVLNPVRAGMVKAAQDWSWSNYRATAGIIASPAWLQVKPVWKQLAYKQVEARKRYREFVQQGIGQASPWGQLRGQIYLGEDDFLARMEKLARKQSPANVPKRQLHPTRLDKVAVLACISQIYSLQVAEILSKSHAEAYHCAAWLLRRSANMPLKKVADLFGVSPSRVSHIQRAMEIGQPSRLRKRAMLKCNIKQ
ncbi:MAG: transposase [Gammaproteobacteria bacterium]|nr:transposase [Gammaproteobacteria bacterium]